VGAGSLNHLVTKSPSFSSGNNYSGNIECVADYEPSNAAYLSWQTGTSTNTSTYAGAFGNITKNNTKFEIFSFDINNVYRNGINITTTSTSNSSIPSGAYNSNPIYIGKRVDAATTDSFFKGDIAVLMIYNRTLSRVEILQNYNALKSRFNLS